MFAWILFWLLDWAKKGVYRKQRDINFNTKILKSIEILTLQQSALKIKDHVEHVQNKVDVQKSYRFYVCKNEYLTTLNYIDNSDWHRHKWTFCFILKFWRCFTFFQHFNVILLKQIDSNECNRRKHLSAVLLNFRKLCEHIFYKRIRWLDCYWSNDCWLLVVRCKFLFLTDFFRKIEWKHWNFTEPF